MKKRSGKSETRPAGARGALAGPLLRKGGAHGKPHKALRRLDKSRKPAADDEPAD